MPQSDCVDFLQWALPRLGLTWSGFRRVRRQVCRRLGRRIQELRLPGFATYRDYVARHPEEWPTVDACCRISISRWVRDAAVFDTLGREVLPALAPDSRARGASALRCWSAGCASGEEPYSLGALWRLHLAPRFPSLDLVILATDADAELLERARQATYPESSLREVPAEWRERVFTRTDGRFTVKPEFRVNIAFQEQDLREMTPVGPLDLILCRYLAFTYFDDATRRDVLGRMLAVLRPAGVLVIGAKEQLPEGIPGLAPWPRESAIYRRLC